MASFRSDVSDKEQVDLERALDDSAIRLHQGDVKNNGQTVFIMANGFADASSTYARQNGQKIHGGTNDTFANSRLRYAGILGHYDDNPSVFREPGKA